MPSDVKKPGFLPLSLILAATAFLYLPTLFYEFTYDDRYQILRNPRIESWKYLGSYFVHNVWFHNSPQGAYYRPLFLIWLRLNQQLFGYHPLGWHATTVLLHLATVTLVYELLRRTISEPFVVIVGTAVFALHPAHLESVAWVSGLTDPLLAIPMIAALLCWLSYRRNKRPSSLACSLLLTTIALLAKETAIILPLLVFAYACALSDAPSLAERLREGYREFAPFFCTVAAFWFLRSLALRNEHLALGRDLRDILPNVPGLLWFYGTHLTGLAPVGIYYDFIPTGWRWTAAIIGVVCLVAIACCTYVAARRSPALLMSLAWAILPIAMATAAVAVFLDLHDNVHDRYLYLSAIGFGIAVALLLAQFRFGSARVFGRPVGEMIGAVVVLSTMFVASLAQLPQWHDDLVLFQRSTETAPQNPMALKQFGYQLHLRNRDPEAQRIYERVLSLDPDDKDANFALAIIAYQEDKWDEVQHYCVRAQKASPSLLPCYRFQGISLLRLGRIEEAEATMRRAVAIWPQEPRQHVVLGEIFEAEGKRELARQEFEKELQIGELGEARFELAKVQP